MPKAMCLILMSTLLTTACASIRQLDDVQIGMTAQEVKEKLGSPHDQSVSFRGEVLTYDLVYANKFWQAVLTYPTIGIVYLVDRRYSLQFENDKLVSIERTQGSSGGQGLAGVGSVLKGMGDGMANQNRVNCTTTNYGYSSQTTCY